MCVCVSSFLSLSLFISLYLSQTYVRVSVRERERNGSSSPLLQVTTLSPLDEKRERPLHPKEFETLNYFFSLPRNLSLSPLKTSTLSREEQKNTRTRIKEAERERERVSFVRVNLVV